MSSDDYDSPWKELLEQYFPEFMAFFFPDAHTDIDWAQGYENLDKELQQIVRDAELGRRFADKLVRVHRRSGAAQVVLVHVEVQGSVEAEFAKRMFVYYYRLFDRYDKPVVSLAVLGDEQAGWRPDSYETALWGCRASLQFPVVKLLDYASRWDELEADPNPFAVVAMAHVQTRATRADPETRLRWKLRLVRLLYERGYAREQVLELLRCLDWLMALPAGLEQRFQHEVATWEATMGKPYLATFERVAMEQGMQQGVQQGMQQGRVAQARSALLTILETRFGALPASYRQRIEMMEELDTLEALLRIAVTVASLDALDPAL